MLCYDVCETIKYSGGSEALGRLVPFNCGSLRLQETEHGPATAPLPASSSSLSHPPLGTWESPNIYSKC